MLRKKPVTTLLIIILLSASASHAEAAGAFFPQAGNSAPKIARVNYSIFHDGGSTTLLVQPFYSGDRQPFAWAIPVPALPDTDCANALSNDPYPEMAIRTDPTVGVVFYEDVVELDAGGGCGAIDQEEKRTGGQAFVYYRSTTNLVMNSSYVLARVTNDSDNALETWLDGNSYDNAGAFELGAYYRAKGWHFVVMEVVPQMEAGSASSEAMMPLILEFNSSDLTVPLYSIASSAEDEVTITVYAFTSRRMFVTNYAVVSFAGPLTVQSSYEAIITAQSRGRFVLEYADYSPVDQFEDTPLSTLILHPYMLTRFTGTFPAEGMYDDIKLAFYPTNDPVHPVSYVAITPGITGAPPKGGRGPWPLLPLALILLFVFLIKFLRSRNRSFRLLPLGTQHAPLCN
ncbi:MAG: DUF2330 domain-containing protein [Planctomycetota bacterium]|jgi:hypothetical protein